MARYHCLLLFMSFLLTTAKAKCYYPNGDSENGLEHQPCISVEGQESFCCSLNRTNPPGGSLDDGYTVDFCMKNGLCKNVADGDTVTYFRSMCSTPEWPEANCLDPCRGSDTGATPPMTPCDGTENSTVWCCGDKADCCGTTSAVTIAPVLAAVASASSPSTSATATPSDTPSTPSTADSSSLSTGAMAGIGVGAVIGTMVILAGLGYFWMRHRKSTAGGNTATPMVDKNMRMHNGAAEVSGLNHRKQPTLVEVDGSNTRAMLELNTGDGLRHELGDGREYR
ncbi:hypothetical protein ASPVEDRAFT_88981 [Aspergillus versicolor CBS 583.65]|uniref:Mid2 domain-containing protein n=1 Tax=Aspergillus versicolor CBS 583.65 TaxID=1036611 RepID=A0A1L9Q1V5_ASPVE|nr:uncharacterized protein ASPVEDRAFT_88981 [Aspergillus versicolor CBS 583.65]OJJ07740.1 hypothetical protein ASPVEDRAFT_88981 [Aspergillus versicolor CBS 583.65]